MAHDKTRAEFEARKARALAMGSTKRLAERKAAGHMNARERIDALLDAGSFVEHGLFARSYRAEDAERSPADGVVAGFGEIDRRPVAVIAADFTTLGASSSRVMGKKTRHVKGIAAEHGMPVVFLGECSGGRIPDLMGSDGIGAAGDASFYDRARETPWVSAILGQSYGGSTWYAMMSDAVIMRKGAIMAVASPNVTSVATTESVDLEELGGWRMQTEVTGQADLAVETDRDALGAVARFLSYLPSHAREAPPRAAVPAGSDEASATLLDLVPESRAKVYDVRKVLEAVVDKGSLFQIKERFARVAVTAFGRIDGWPIGIVASNPLVKGGALDGDACDKIISFMVLCDSFNVPIVQFADTPGFLVGVEGERRKLPSKIMNYIQALEMTTVPKFAVVMRKSYGQAYLNMGGGKSDAVAAWYSADVGFMDPAVGVNVVHGVRQSDDPKRYAELAEKLGRANSAYDLAAPYFAQAVIDPRETRHWLKRMLEVHRKRPTGGVGRHRMATWPTKF